MAITFTLEEWKTMRQLGRTSLLYLCNNVLGYKDVQKGVHGNLYKSLQKFKGGEDSTVGKGQSGPADPSRINAGRIEDLVTGYKPYVPDIWDLEGARERLILIPRNHLKTTVATIAHTIQWVINYPNIRILLSSGTGDQVKGFIRAIKEHFVSNEMFRWLYPEFVPHGKAVKEFGNQEMFSVPCRRLIRPEPTVNTLSVGAVVAGAHYDVIKHDDLVDKENCRTPEQIQTVKNHFGMLDPLLQRVEPSETRPTSQCHGWTDVIGTRYDYSDLYGTIIDGHRKTLAATGASDWLILEQSAVVSGELSDPENCVTLWPKRFPPEELLRIANDPTRGWPHLCTPAESPVLMSDWSEKPISEIKAGDYVIGFKAGGTANRMKLRPVKVLSVHKTVGMVSQVKMSSGRTVKCTPEHKWWTMRAPSVGDRHKPYLPARVGQELFSVVSDMPVLNPDQQRWMDWLGGILDGEGSCQKGNTIFISQSHTANPEVCNGIRECLEVLGFKWTQFTRPAGIYGGRKHQPATQWMLKGGRSMMRQILLQAKMSKRQRVIDSMYFRGGVREIRTEKHIVQDISPLGFDQVYALETETGNYVVWGFASSNSSQYLMNPRSEADGLLESEKEIVWVPQDVIRKLYAYLTLHCTVDLAGMEPSTNKLSDNDFTVINLHGFGHDGTLYVLSVLRGRYTPFEVIDLLFKLSALHPRLMDIKVEKEAHARVLLPFLKREMVKRGKYLPIVEIKRDNRTSKQQRIKGLQPWFRNQSIKFADSQAHKLAIIDEIMRFPRYAHDDILDTIADAMQNRDGGVAIDVVPMEGKGPDMIMWEQRRKNQDGSITIPNFSPTQQNLYDVLFAEKAAEEPANVDSMSGW